MKSTLKKINLLKFVVGAVAILFFVFQSKVADAQMKSYHYKFIVYYDSDEDSTITRIKLQAILDTLSLFSNYSIDSIHGHTDYEGSDEYNERLSRRRARFVKNYFIDNNILRNKIHNVFGFGENRLVCNDTTEECKALCRRTEIYVTFKNFEKDTTIVQQNGFKVFIPKNSMSKDLIDNMNIISATNTEQMIENKMITMTDEGYLLSSCGMFTIDYKDNAVRQILLNQVIADSVKLSVYMPVTSTDTSNYTVWNGVEQNGFIVWTNTSQSMQIIDIEGKKYYLLQVPVVANINGDKLILQASQTRLKIRQYNFFQYIGSVFKQTTKYLNIKNVFSINNETNSVLLSQKQTAIFNWQSKFIISNFGSLIYIESVDKSINGYYSRQDLKYRWWNNSYILKIQNKTVSY